MLRVGLSFGLALAVAVSAAAHAAETVTIGYLRPADRIFTLSLVERPPEDLGLAGALTAIADNDTTGRFTGQDFELVHEAVADDPQAAREAADRLAAAGADWLAVDLDAEGLTAAAEAAAAHDMLVFNLGAPDDRLRVEACLPNVVHVAPSRAMLADALAQYLVWKQWPRWLLITGSHPEDRAYAEAVKRAAQRFGGRVVEERVFEDAGGARTTDSGHVQVQRRMPVFLQGAPEHDVVIVADENEVFGPYVPYRTWEPRPVAGTAGLVPTAWSPAHEQWGGIQLQNRFLETHGRRMRQEDMLAWMAVRMIGEAATRTGGADEAAVDAYILGPEFELAAFKGQALTLRPWSRQLRQPVLLADGETVVSVSPQEGFLHPGSYLDTLGYDAPEVACDFDGG